MSDKDQFYIEWVDSGYEPEIAPNPAYPDGVDADMSRGKRPACVTALPYPAKRCGMYVIRCKTCNGQFGLTTAGRADDPRSVRLPCQMKTEL